MAKLSLQINVLIIFIFIASSEVRWSGCGGAGHDITVQAQLRPQLTLAAKLSSPPSFCIFIVLIIIDIIAASEIYDLAK